MKSYEAKFYRAKSGVFVLDYRATLEEAKADTKEHGWKMKDIETIKIKNVKAALLHLLNH